VHDLSQLEQRGVATVLLCTTPFEPAAHEQWQALGFGQDAVVAVGHPLGSMPHAQVLAEAELAVEPVIAALTGGRRESGVRRRGAKSNGQRPAARKSGQPSRNGGQSVAPARAAPSAHHQHQHCDDGDT
jgi:hypothetical protein